MQILQKYKLSISQVQIRYFHKKVSSLFTRLVPDFENVVDVCWVKNNRCSENHLTPAKIICSLDILE